MTDEQIIKELKEAIANKDQKRLLELEERLVRFYGDGLGMWLNSQLTLEENNEYGRIKHA